MDKAVKLSEGTREPQYNSCLRTREEQGLTSLGLMTNQVWEDDPRRLAFVLARYKFVSKMLSGKASVGELGCGDAFGTRIVMQTTGKVVAYDDLDLPLGRVRIRPDGGAGGHRGVASIIAMNVDFVRVRIGIGRPPADVDPVAFVLSPFAAEERDGLRQALVRAADGVEIVLRDGVEAAMRACNPPPVEPP